MSIRPTPNTSLINELNSWYPTALTTINQIDDPSIWTNITVMLPPVGVKVYIFYFNNISERFSIGIGVFNENQNWSIYGNKQFIAHPGTDVRAWYVGIDLLVPVEIQNLTVS